MVFSAAAYRLEVLRKIIHLSSLWIPFAYMVLPYHTMVMLLGTATCVVIALDVLRLFNPACRRFFHGLFGMVMRSHEIENRLSGASYLLAGAVLTVALFTKHIAITALMVLIISDTCASLIGKRFGKTPFFTKTMEGTMAFILSGGLVVIATGTLFQWSYTLFTAGIVAVCAGALVEVLSGIGGIDDNITIPLTVGSIMTLIIG